MINKRDQNDIPVASGVSSTDGFTPLSFRVDPVTDHLLVKSISSSNSATSATKDKRDQNDIPSKYGVSSVDGITMVPIRTDSNGYLLTKSI